MKKHSAQHSEEVRESRMVDQNSGISTKLASNEVTMLPLN